MFRNMRPGDPDKNQEMLLLLFSMQRPELGFAELPRDRNNQDLVHLVQLQCLFNNLRHRDKHADSQLHGRLRQLHWGI